MRVPALITALLLASAPIAAAAQSVGERPAATSGTYKQCKAGAASMADERKCLNDELAWAQTALRIVEDDAGADPESRALWNALLEHDCSAEGRLADSGNSGDMRETACRIELTYERADYLQRAGRW